MSISRCLGHFFCSLPASFFCACQRNYIPIGGEPISDSLPNHIASPVHIYAKITITVITITVRKLRGSAVKKRELFIYNNILYIYYIIYNIYIEMHTHAHSRCENGKN